MDREEAISVIENEIQIDVRLCTDDQVDRFQTALYMAISALRADHTGDAADMMTKADLLARAEAAEAREKNLIEAVKMVTERAEKAERNIAELMGISPQERITTCFGHPLDRVRELVKADREGRCVVLPVKNGDKVYCLQSYFNDAKMRSEKKVKCRIVDFVQSVPDLFECNGVIYKFCDIDKTVFLTREAAEAALKGEQDG